ncbi:hypothetical protein E2542_SST16761 [Spatholobus suberectus]|nr:hypothetical protein E2542_SST16761 [Spatholobus suberectus]
MQIMNIFKIFIFESIAEANQGDKEDSMPKHRWVFAIGDLNSIFRTFVAISSSIVIGKTGFNSLCFATVIRARTLVFCRLRLPLVAQTLWDVFWIGTHCDKSNANSQICIV